MRRTVHVIEKQMTSYLFMFEYLIVDMLISYIQC